MAKETLELHLYGMELDGESIPKPTDSNKIAIPKGGFINFIEVWMPVRRIHTT